MRPHRILYTIFISVFISLLIVGLDVLAYFMFSPNKPEDEGFIPMTRVKINVVLKEGKIAPPTPAN